MERRLVLRMGTAGRVLIDDDGGTRPVDDFRRSSTSWPLVSDSSLILVVGAAIPRTASVGFRSICKSTCIVKMMKTHDHFGAVATGRVGDDAAVVGAVKSGSGVGGGVGGWLARPVTSGGGDEGGGGCGGGCDGGRGREAKKRRAAACTLRPRHCTDRVDWPLVELTLDGGRVVAALESRA